ncbi:hypothetical protein LHK_02779 [Laribacter hongkongensis HLHK9]|uniref:Uncharacterized protein n=2 Tax=Laribacter hongkongensis TaxID=168471 RepID=C1DDC7_LARHH|nr:hypothetical protein LHK_02779 [Laribacter hongkongensis HLHK9]ASJ25627.1 hypothetical protein LHGZ1_2796 [Laribacter hongkongensis]
MRDSPSTGQARADGHPAMKKCHVKDQKKAQPESPIARNST